MRRSCSIWTRLTGFDQLTNPAETLLFGGKNKEAGAMADKVSHSYRQWLDKLQLAVRMAAPDTPYVKVHSESLVGLFTCVFVKVSEQHALRDINVCTVKR